MLEFEVWKPWIAASSYDFWNDEPAPLIVVLPEPEPPPLLPQAASTVARPTATASTRGRFKVAITDFLRAGGRVRGAVRRRAAYEWEVARSSRRDGRDVNRTETVGYSNAPSEASASPGSAPVTMNATHRPIITAWSAARS